MPSLPNSNSDVFFGEVGNPLPNWREIEYNGEEDPTDEERQSAAAMLGFDPSELDDSTDDNSINENKSMDIPIIPPSPFLKAKSLNDDGIKALDNWALKAGFTGTRKDKLGRNRCYSNGKPIPCDKPSQPSQQKPQQQQPRQEVQQQHRVEPQQQKPAEKPQQSQPAAKPQKINQTTLKPKATLKPIFSQEELSLPKAASQPVPPNSGYEKLAQAAVEGDKQLQKLLDLGKGLSTKIGGRVIPPGTSMEDIDEALAADDKSPVILLAPIKSRKRSEEKVAADYGGDWSKLTDITRASVAVSSVDEIYKTMDTLRNLGMEIAKAPKDRINNPLPSGYRDVMMTIRMPNGIIAELQLHLKDILLVKSKEHHGYEVIRAMDAKMAQEGRTQRTPKEQAIVDEIESKSRALYEAAWKKAMGEV